MIALIVSKLVLVVIFLVAITQVSAPIEAGPGINQLTRSRGSC